MFPFYMRHAARASAFIIYCLMITIDTPNMCMISTGVIFTHKFIHLVQVAWPMQHTKRNNKFTKHRQMRNKRKIN